MPTPVENYIQQLDLPNLVELFDIVYQEITYYITNSLITGGIYWNNNLYIGLPLSITGITYNETNAEEIPKLQITNTENRLGTLFNSIPNLKGATITYVQTFESYTGLTALESSSLYTFKRRLTIDRLLSKHPAYIVYELGTLASVKEKVYPPRQMLRDGRNKMRFEGLGINKQT